MRTDEDGEVLDDAFCEWIRQLDESVIQGEYGYEEGEFAIYPSHWRELYDKGCSPAEAFKRALEAYANARRADLADFADRLWGDGPPQGTILWPKGMT